MVAFLIPLVVVSLSLAGAAVDLARNVLESKNAQDALTSLTTGSDVRSLDFRRPDWGQAVEVARKHGAGAMGAARTLLGGATGVIVGVVVFVASFYAFLFEGPRLYRWSLDHSPIARGHFERLSDVVAEVGRGLIIGVGLTALAQAAVATIGYVAIGVPRPFVLGLLTAIAALIPSIGTALVWIAVTAGLAIAGQTGGAIAMLAVGCIVSTVDNVLRPVLARHAELKLDVLVLFLAMVGGVAVLGGGGLLLGPLFVRLAIEALAILRERRVAPASVAGSELTRSSVR